ncbi:sterile alpha motif domain-containing protein 3-like isoform X1 [Alosa pseudoharengus]|uniref:sterile alpha motif domain-containing protein 3-like isoform X1 n=2 Tax=Alosa pseudoharengus TaxID=34774 RepID=UPI003F8AD30A
MKSQVMFMKELNKLRNSQNSQSFPEQQVRCVNQSADMVVSKQAFNLSLALILLLFLSSPRYEAGLLLEDHTPCSQYPSHKMYGDVLGNLITKFPFLRDGSSSGHETLLECLRNKFKKERIPLVHNSTVLQMKKNYGTKKRMVEQTSYVDTTIEPELAKRREELLDYSASHSNSSSSLEVLEMEAVGEDDTSYQEHLNFILRELAKKQPNLAEIKIRMRRTFFKRIEAMTLPTKKVMEIFPFLGIPQLMHHEMQMKFGIDMDRSLQTAIHELAPRIIRVVKEGSQKRFSPSLLEPTNERLEDAALLLLPELFKEKTEFLYCVEDEVHPCPTVVFHGSLNVLKADTISIRPDGLTLTTGKMTIAEALEYLFST